MAVKLYYSLKKMVKMTPDTIGRQNLLSIEMIETSNIMVMYNSLSVRCMRISAICKENKKLSYDKKISKDTMQWIFIDISILCIISYIIISTFLGCFSGRTLICVFVICFPIQLLLNIYFSYAIKNDSFISISGFDNKMKYNICEVKSYWHK